MKDMRKSTAKGEEKYTVSFSDVPPAAYQDDCVRNHKPLVHVTMPRKDRKRRIAKVSMDLFYVRNRDYYDRCTFFVTEMEDAIKTAYGGEYLGLHGPGVLTLVSHIPEAKAEWLAQEFVRIYEKHRGVD